MGAVRDGLLGSRGKEFAIAFAAGAAALLASLANFLTYNAYPYIRAEVGLVVLGMLALAAAMAAWYVPQRQWGRSLLEGILAGLFIDLNTDSVPLIVGVVIAIAGFTAWRRNTLLGPMAMLGSVILFTTLVGIGSGPAWLVNEPGATGGKLDPNKPAFVHIILDEHLGLEGMRNEGVNGKALGDELRDFYTAAGFAVYGGAYSQHHHSANSIPFMLNYGRRLGLNAGRRGVDTGQTDHLGLLVDSGYRLKILQSDYANVCYRARFFQCTTYDSASLRPTLTVPMSLSQRTELVTQKFLKLSDAFLAGSKGYNSLASQLRTTGVPIPLFRSSAAHSSSVASSVAFDRFAAEMKYARPGEAYFAHFILPHHPYAFQRDCSFRKRPWNGLNTFATLRTKRLEYYEQVRCAKRKVETMLTALSQSPAGANSIVIIHGDHGSRLARFDLPVAGTEQITDDDLIAGFSTLFAVRGPGIGSTYNSRPQAVASLLSQFARSRFTAVPAADRPLDALHLAGPELEPRGTIRFPRAWIEGLDRPASGQ